MKKIYILAVVWPLITSCSSFNSEGTKWNSSFYRTKKACSKENCDDRYVSEANRRTDNLFLLRSGQLIDKEQKDK